MEFSHRTRSKNLEALARDDFDVLVIGGGITGAGVARDAALRGLSVGLMESRDFAAGTSSRSSKLVHGGLRYLQQGDVGLVREAATERYAIRKLAPYLARPTEMIVPVRSRAGHAKIRVGLWTYDRIAGVPDEERHRMVRIDEAVAAEPLLKRGAFFGAGFYYEYVTDDARLVMAVVRTAAELGAVIANYTEVTDFTTENGRLSGVVARDRLSGAELPVRGRVVINAAGPWVDELRLRADTRGKPRLHLTKGIHIGVRRERLDLGHTVVMNARDGRGVFAIPHGEVTYIGTTDTDYPAPELDPSITLDDVTYLLDAANRTFAVEPLEPSDVVSAWAGLRPLLHQEGKKPSELSRKDEVMVSKSGLLSIAGGKLTTFRRMAARIVDMTCEQLREQGVKPPPRRGQSDEVPLVGGETGDDVDGYARRLVRRFPAIGRDVIDRLVRYYGSGAAKLAENMSLDPTLAARYAPGLPLTRAEVEHAVRDEMAVTLRDFLDRRSRLLLWNPDNGVSVAGGVARTMGSLLDWDRDRIEAEIAQYRTLIADLQAFQNEEAEAEPAAQAAHG